MLSLRNFVMSFVCVPFTGSLLSYMSSQETAFGSVTRLGWYLSPRLSPAVHVQVTLSFLKRTATFPYWVARLCVVASRSLSWSRRFPYFSYCEILSWFAFSVEPRSNSLCAADSRAWLCLIEPSALSDGPQYPPELPVSKVFLKWLLKTFSSRSSSMCIPRSCFWNSSRIVASISAACFFVAEPQLWPFLYFSMAVSRCPRVGGNLSPLRARRSSMEMFVENGTLELDLMPALIFLRRSSPSLYSISFLLVSAFLSSSLISVFAALSPLAISASMSLVSFFRTADLG